MPKILAGHRGRIAAVSTTKDDRFALSGGSDKTLKLWNIESGECPRTFVGHDAEVSALAIVPSGPFVLSGGCDETLRLWNIESGECVRALKGHVGEVCCVAVAPDGQTAISGGEDGTLRLWELGAGRCQRVFDGHPARKDMQSLIRGSNSEIAYNDVLSNYTVAPTYEADTISFFGHADTVTSVALSPDGLLIVSSSRDTTVRLWDVRSGKCLWIFGGHHNRHGFSVNNVAIAPNGKRVVSLSETLRVWKLSRKTIRRALWGVVSEKSLATLGGEQMLGRAMAVMPDARHVLVTTDRGKTISRFRLKSGRHVSDFEPSSHQVSSLAVDSRGYRVVTGGNDGNIELWDLRKEGAR